MQKLYFLGPKGTYSELAALRFLKILSSEYALEWVSTIAKIIDLFTVGHGSMSCIIKDGVHDIIAEIKKMLNNNAK